MKKTLYILAFIFSLYACEKEEIEPTPSNDIINYYEIKNDNPDDPVQCVRYELYEKYGVPVYFNDTIAKVFVKISPSGDSVFRYERIDMNWEFHSSSIGAYRYVYTYYENDADKLRALEIVRNYLEKASAPLRPYTILATKITQKLNIKNGGNVLYDSYEIGYRTLLLQNLSTQNTPEKVNTFTTLIRKMMITSRLKNFKRESEEFSTVSDAKWYNKTFNIPEPDGLGVVWDSSHVMKRYNNSGVYQRDEKIECSAMRIKYKFYERDYPYESEEAIESIRYKARTKLGAFGFVDTNKNNSLDSYSKDSELSLFLDEILNTTRTEFTRRWGHCPLVMKKYNILYKIIKEQLDVDLDAEN